MKHRYFPLEKLEELLHLKNLIYESKAYSKAEEIIESMQLRGKCPLSIDLTLILMQAIRDPNVANLSFAIIRFINNLMDSQQDSVHAVPLHALCLQLKIPQLWVDVRHGICHHNLPSETLLKSIVSQMMNYLHNEFWCKLPDTNKQLCLWSQDLILLFLKDHTLETFKYLEKMSCRDFYYYVETIVPRVLLTEDWVADYLGYLLVFIAQKETCKIPKNLERSFACALVYFCLENNITLPPQYSKLYDEYSKDIIICGLLSKSNCRESLMQLSNFGCDESLINERCQIELDLKLPNGKPIFSELATVIGDIDTEWLMENESSEPRYIDPRFLEQETKFDLEFNTNKFLQFKKEQMTGFCKSK
eukprot:NODE_173_length_14219_cov_0.603824.p5 type:complete len:361 gc:universal NODE_173_length_14219_cov_0.603824:5184-4102(-)